MPKISENAIRICKRCGKEYHPKSSRQQCCNAPIQVPCAICGKMMDQICTFADQPKTCSKECADALIKQKRESSAAKLTKICKYCGKEFTPKFVREEYCEGPHFANCEVCGKSYEVKDVKRSDARRTCSEECRFKLQVQNTDYDKMVENLVNTLQDKYGVDNAAKIPGTHDKIKATTLERYGKAWYSQTDEYKRRVELTDKDKYGYEHHLKSPDIIDKRTTTVQDKYGVDNVFQADEIKERSKQTLQAKYGVNNISMLNISNQARWQSFVQDPIAYLRSTYTERVTMAKLAIDLGACLSWIYVQLKGLDVSNYIKHATSSMETYIYDFISEICPNLQVNQHDRTVIAPYELDIFIPELNIAIECNPTVTHNSSFPDPWGGDPKPKQYHYIKSQMCNNKGIFLFHIFGYDWTHKVDIICSMIQNLLGVNSIKIYARNCEIRDVTPADAKQFLTLNHLQGDAVCSVRLGLYYNDELVALMTLGKPRVTIGNHTAEWELIRFCSKLNTTVIGGASKLFKYFQDTYSPNTVISFSDVSHTRGNIYPKLNFKLVNISGPGYHWVDTNTDVCYNRMIAQKHNLKNFLKDDLIDLSQTEKQIMEAHGFAQVFDSGTITWEWRNNQ